MSTLAAANPTGAVLPPWTLRYGSSLFVMTIYKLKNCAGAQLFYCKISSIFFSSASLLNGLEGRGAAGFAGSADGAGRDDVDMGILPLLCAGYGGCAVVGRSVVLGAIIIRERTTSAFVFRSCSRFLASSGTARNITDTKTPSVCPSIL